MSLNAKVPKIGAKLTSTEKNDLGNSPASDGVLGKAINPGVKRVRDL